MSKQFDPFRDLDDAKLSPVGRDLVEGLKEVYHDLAGEKKLASRTVRVPDQVDVRAIRKRLGLSQAEFARRYGFNVRAIQQWEQKRRQPEGAARAYLTVIANNPKSVEEALLAR